MKLKPSSLVCFTFLFIRSLIEECTTFDTLQREVKVKLKSDNKNLKEKNKKDVAEDSRIDFQLTWNTRSDITSPVTDSLLRKSDQSDASDSKKSSEDLIHVSEVTNMLLEVKSVTLAMKLPGDDKVRNKRNCMSSEKLYLRIVVVCNFTAILRASTLLHSTLSLYCTQPCSIVIQSSLLHCALICNPLLLLVCFFVLYASQLTAQFPDSVSLRGQKHLRCLTDHVKAGNTMQPIATQHFYL